MAMWLLEQGMLDAMASTDISAIGNRTVLVNKALTGPSQVSVLGLLTKAPDMRASFLGIANTTYGDIADALIKLEQDDSVKAIDLLVDSPGGNTDGLFDLIEVMQLVSKPINVIVDGMAASAAYAIASQGTSISASKSSSVGSIGVVTEMRKDTGTHTIASSKAPNKRPDPNTVQGMSAIQAHLDEIHDMFVQAIATGRGVSADTINTAYGQGAVMFAERALAAGMIDEVLTRKITGGQSALVGVKMDLQQLQAGHPTTYAEAVSVGVNQERERVLAHLTLGNASGDTKTSMAAIEEGSALTPSIQAKYLAAGMNKRDLEARTEGAPLAVEPLKDAATESSEVVNIVARALGVDLNG